MEEQKLSPPLDTQISWGSWSAFAGYEKRNSQECQFHSNQSSKENIKVVSSCLSPLEPGIVSSFLLFPSMVHGPQGL